MEKQYGLDPHYYQCILRLPKASQVKIYEPDKIMNCRRKLSTVEKLNYLIELKEALEKRLKIIESGQEIVCFEYLKYSDYLDQKAQAIMNNTWHPFISQCPRCKDNEK